MSLLRGNRSQAIVAACLILYGAFTAWGVVAQPVAHFTSPPEGSVIQDQIYIEISYESKTADPVARIQLFVDDHRAFDYALPHQQGLGTQAFRWNTAQLAAGPHTLTAKVYDARGRVCTSPPSIRVYVDSGAGGPGPSLPTPAKPDEIPPTVRLTSPANGATVAGKIEIGIEATDPSGVKFVFVYIDDQFKAMTNIPPYRFPQDTAVLTNGVHVLRAEAVDVYDNRGRSADTYFTVANPLYATVTPRETLLPPVAPPAPPSATSVALPRPDGLTGRPGIPVAALPTAPIVTQTVGEPDHGPAVTPSMTRLAALPSGERPTVYDVRADRPDVKPAAAPVRMASAPKLTPPASRAAQSPATAASGARYAAVPSAIKLAGLPTLVETSAPIASRPLLTSPAPSAPPAAALPATGPAPATAKALRVAALPRPTAAGAPSREALPPMQPRATRPNALPIEHVVHLGGKQFTVVFDQSELKLRTNPLMAQGIPVGPLRELFEHAGGQVDWFPVEKRVLATKDQVSLGLKIGDRSAQLNGQRVVLKLAPFVRNGRTMVPFSFLEKALNVTVMYKPATNRLLITSNNF